MKRPVFFALIFCLLFLSLPTRAWQVLLPRAAYDAFEPQAQPCPDRVEVGDEWVRYTFAQDFFDFIRLAPMDRQVSGLARNLQGTFVESQNSFHLDVKALYEDLVLSYQVASFTPQQIDRALYALQNSETRYWEGAKSIYLERVPYLREKGLATPEQAELAQALYERNHCVEAEDGARLLLSDAGRSRIRWFAQPLLRPADAETTARFERAAEELGLTLCALYPLDVRSLKAAKGVEKKLPMEKLDQPPLWPDFNVAYNIDGFTLTIEGAPAATQALWQDPSGEIRPLPLQAQGAALRLILPEVGFVGLATQAD